MELIDITVPICDGMFVYDGDPEVRLSRMKSIEAGDVANLTCPGRTREGLMPR